MSDLLTKMPLVYEQFERVRYSVCLSDNDLYFIADDIYFSRNDGYLKIRLTCEKNDYTIKRLSTLFNKHRGCNSKSDLAFNMEIESTSHGEVLNREMFCGCIMTRIDFNPYDGYAESNFIGLSIDIRYDYVKDSYKSVPEQIAEKIDSAIIEDIFGTDNNRRKKRYIHQYGTAYKEEYDKEEDYKSRYKIKHHQKVD